MRKEEEGAERELGVFFNDLRYFPLTGGLLLRSIQEKMNSGEEKGQADTEILAVSLLAVISSDYITPLPTLASLGIVFRAPYNRRLLRAAQITDTNRSILTYIIAY